MKTPLSFRAPRAAFTLIELLAAIGIIALLVALISPAVSKMRRTADATQCAANLRQVYSLWSEDVQNYNNQVPPAFNELTEEVAGVRQGQGWLNKTWQELTENNTKTVGADKVFGCPTQRKSRKLAVNARTYSMNSNVANTYWNGIQNAPGQMPKFIPPIMYTKFEKPSKTMIFSDGAWDGSGYNSGVNGLNKFPETIHDGAANFVFMDGHIERLKAADIPSGLVISEPIQPQNTPTSIFWVGR